MQKIARNTLHFLFLTFAGWAGLNLAAGVAVVLSGFGNWMLGNITGMLVCLAFVVWSFMFRYFRLRGVVTMLVAMSLALAAVAVCGMNAQVFLQGVLGGSARKLCPSQAAAHADAWIYRFQDAQVLPAFSGAYEHAYRDAQDYPCTVRYCVAPLVDAAAATDEAWRAAGVPVWVAGEDVDEWPQVASGFRPAREEGKYYRQAVRQAEKDFGIRSRPNALVILQDPEPERTVAEAGAELIANFKMFNLIWIIGMLVLSPYFILCTPRGPTGA